MFGRKNTTFLSGYSLAIAAALLFGISTPLAKLLLRQAQPWMLAGLLYLGSGLGLAAYYYINKIMHKANPEGAALRGSDWIWLSGPILFGGIAAPVLLMQGLLNCSASLSALLLNLEGVLTILIAWFVFKEHIDRRTGLGMILIIVGCTSLSLGSGGGHTSGWGVLAIVGACLCWALDNNLTRMIAASDPVFISMVKGCVAGSVNIVIAISLGGKFPAFSLVLAVALIGLICYGISLIAFILALRQVGTARTAALFSIAPFFGAMIAITFFGEPATPRLLLAAFSMGIGVLLLLTESHRYSHHHEWLVHEHRHTHDEQHRHEHDHAAKIVEPHCHLHEHEPLALAHYPELHHRHSH